MKNKSSNIVIIILASILVSIIIVFLILWTNKIKSQKDEKKFKDLLKVTIEKDGIEGLLSKADVNVDNIYTTEEGVNVFINTDYNKVLSTEEKVNKSVYNKGKDSVVYITTFNSDYKSQGSGVIISSLGYIITNKHVIVDNPKKIYVYLNNGDSNQATLVGSDSETDLALLKIENTNLKEVTFGVSKDLSVGQKVYSLTNPQGFERSLTTGIVSGLSRPVRNLNKGLIMDLIQTDSVVSKGSSGGALFDSKARLIGLVTLINSESGKFEGTAFAIPVETLMFVIPQLIENGYVKRGWVDFSFSELDPVLSSYANLPITKGLIVNKLDKNSESYKQGLRSGTKKVKYGDQTIYLGGDIITKVNDVKVDDFSDFYVLLSKSHAQDVYNFEVYRDGEYKNIKIKLCKRDKVWQ